MAFIMMQCFPLSLVCWGFFGHKSMLNFFQMCLLNHLDDYVGVFLYSVNVVYCIDQISGVEPSLYFRNKSHLVMVRNPFTMLLNLAC